MLRLLFILFIALVLAAHAEESPEYIEIHGNGIYSTDERSQASKRQEEMRKDWEKGGLKRFAERTNYALSGVIFVAVQNLARRGYKEEAKQVDSRWKELDGEIVRLAANPNRAITDWEPWSIKLAALYWIIESKLGYQLCYTLRLTDLATFIWTPVVVFNPCQYGEQEFFYHFAHDENGKYRALGPTVSYWLTNVSCSFASFGAGLFWLCSPLSHLVELGMDKYVCPKLAPKLYNWACN